MKRGMSLWGAVAAVGLAALTGCKGSSGPATPELSYRSICSGCHGMDGKGDAAMYPPLAGHVPRLLALPGGRDYLLHVATFGVEGPINAGGKGWDALMAELRAAPSADLARALNYATTAWGNDAGLPQGFTPFTTEEVDALRPKALAPHEVRRMRPALPSEGGGAEGR